jgi:hypothetical protein
MVDLIEEFGILFLFRMSINILAHANARKSQVLFNLVGQNPWGIVVNTNIYIKKIY